VCFSINFLPDGRLPPRIAVCTLTPRMEGRMKSAFAASMLCSIALSFVACTDEGLPTELARNGGNYTGTFSIIAGTFPETGRISIHFLTDSRYSYTAIRPVVPPANDSLLADGGRYVQHEQNIDMFDDLSGSFLRDDFTLHLNGTYTMRWDGVHIVIEGTSLKGRLQLNLVHGGI